ncbi:hypothetical protein PVAND_008167 [Polypedilum vanderplanki]|uniref:C-type lectin domain-containing protein n=1 Tax=Polypedilum vanderplanki TaxID=319348 RepID=A0A9J6C8M7_POLVA|nr:hypothetical protein PVAND_008167 [Polypedilum vanderplanki]
MKLTKGLNLICFLMAFCFVNSQRPQQQQRESHQQRHHARRVQQQVRTRRIYAMCPPSFTKIGNECYHLSSAKASWLDSHFECKDKNAKLAEPLKYSDRFLRKYLLQRGTTRGEIWIGGMYNWQRNKWQWGYNGKDMTYQSFSQMKPGEDLKYNCAVLNPELKYRWSAKLCFEKHYYLCQHRMPFVSEKNRQRIYIKWNETFPGQMANEIQVYAPQINGNRRGGMQQRSGSVRRPPTSEPQKKSQHNLKNQRTQWNNQLPLDTNNKNNEINPPEVILTQNSQLRRKKQQKDKSRNNRTIILTGNVDLGENIFKKSKQQLIDRKRLNNKPSPSTSTTKFTTDIITSTTPYPNTSSLSYRANHHRHNHYNSDDSKRKIEENERRFLTDLRTTTTIKPAKDERNYTNTYHQQASNSTLSSTVTRQIEKKKRLENIREKLSRLSDEEKMEYLKIKAQRKAQRSKSINDTIP